VTGDGLGSVSSLEDVKGGAISVPVTPPALTQPLSIVVEKPSAGSHAVQVRYVNLKFAFFIVRILLKAIRKV
jgi:hypothetical protein